MQPEVLEAEAHPRPATELADLWPPQGQWTEDDYFALPDSNRHIELSEGEFIMLPHATETHQRVLGTLYTELRAFVQEHGLGVTRFAPLPVRLWPGKVREPDILYVSHAHADRIGEQYYGPPDLVMEVLSPGTRRVDRGDKFIEYSRAGIGEYWLADPEAQAIEVFVLEGGVYVLLGKFGSGQVAHSDLLQGFQVTVDEAFA